MGKRGPKPKARPSIGDGTRPKPPAFLTRVARAEWARVTTVMDRQGILSEADQALLIAYCDVYSRYIKEAAKRNGAPMTLLRTLIDLSSKLLLTPQARAGLRGPPPPKSQDADPLEKLLQKRKTK